MTITHSNDGRAALAEGLAAFVDTGSGTAVVRIRDGSTTLCDIELPDPAYSSDTNGRITVLGVPLEGTATDTGTANNFQVLNQDGDLAYSGSVTAEGGGGDLEIDDTAITSGDPVTLTAHSYRAAE